MKSLISIKRMITANNEIKCYNPYRISENINLEKPLYETNK